MEGRNDHGSAGSAEHEGVIWFFWRSNPNPPSYLDQFINPGGFGMKEGPQPPGCCPFKEA